MIGEWNCVNNFVLRKWALRQLKVTVHLQGCLMCKRCSASGLNCRYRNPYIKLKLRESSLNMTRGDEHIEGGSKNFWTPERGVPKICIL